MTDVRLLDNTITSAIQPDGTLRDDASPELYKARHSASRIHQDVKTQLDRFIKSPSLRDALQEQYYTLREDRYVIPVRAERQQLVEGIVHAVSQTGATVFVEPHALIPWNNRLKHAEEAIKRAEHAVLMDLTQTVARQSDALLANLEAAARFDVWCAKARLALQLNGARPLLGGSSEMKLLAARNPHLLLQGVQAVPNDVVLSPSTPVLVISGPNAGGKSVALTTVGQCVLMTMAGMLPPCAPESLIPVLKGLHAVPGDLEDMDQHLSTFTGHLHRLNRVLPQCGPHHLVLVDEITVGTEPEQGAALGGAYLNELGRSGALVLLATHYERLKAIASTAPNMENASMGMDWNSLVPTYKLEQGIPGSSRTIEIAQRCGTPQAILDDARAMLETHRISDLEAAVEELQASKAAHVSATERLSRELIEQEDLTRRRRNALQLLDAQAHRIVRKKVAEATREVDTALSSISAALDQLQQQPATPALLKQHSRSLSDLRRKMQSQTDGWEQSEALDKLAQRVSNRFCVGSEVFVREFKRTATVLSLDTQTGTARLQMGPMRLQRPIADLVPLEETRQQPPGQRTTVPDTGPAMDPRLDLRGYTVDEALASVQTRLDQMTRMGFGRLAVIHGHGTGQLKKEVRKYLEQSGYAVTFRPADREEGGDGVTIVTPSE
jgi:DNA mismatch repair protein MutS2